MKLPPIRIDIGFSGKKRLNVSALKDQIIENALIGLAREVQADLQNRLRKLEPGLRKELNWLARLTARRVVGSPADRIAPSGVPGAVNLKWPRYSPAYRARKERARRMTWFQYSGSGRLKEAVAASETYLTAFGPIRVSLHLIRDLQVKKMPGGRFSCRVATVKVDLLERLEIDDVWGSLRFLPPAIRYRLRGNPDQAGYKYRPVLDPFLRYYVRRSIPEKIRTWAERSLDGLIVTM